MREFRIFETREKVYVNIIMQARRRSGNIFFNYQKSFSIVLLAVCNSNYEFTLVDTGKAGR